MWGSETVWGGGGCPQARVRQEDVDSQEYHDYGKQDFEPQPRTQGSEDRSLGRWEFPQVCSRNPAPGSDWGTAGETVEWWFHPPVRIEAVDKVYQVAGRVYQVHGKVYQIVGTELSQVVGKVLSQVAGRVWNQAVGRGLSQVVGKVLCRAVGMECCDFDKVMY